ncbi:uncharacterized protein BDW47DRAFT_37917 [Aspergillus candidus]|uniref:Uncharacterized protein n=1 Tax=Aspergillus candidus TaxID=41067 RepID=A0A2I2F9W7_ASPCN|nr:hypothetical protein BDW47DRAFT_37917 [Aspergillus candidus]PLB37421.1 hypothetical protein BDW47DRAFT_37917 [Aspergillus candidus]
MPSPATPHRPSNRGGGGAAARSSPSPTKLKPLDIGEPLGVHDTNSVRSKIRKWQQQGGGVITADEVVYYEDDENSAVESSSKPENDTKTHKRSKSTPRKRLVSDEHWKLNRSSISSINTGANPKFAPPKRISEYTTNDGMQTSPRGRKSHDKTVDTARELRSRSRERARERASTVSESVTRERRKSRASRDVEARLDSKALKEGTFSHNGSSRSGSRPRTADRPHTGAKSEPSESAGKKDAGMEYDSEWAASDADFSELSKRRARGAPPTPKGRETREPPKPPKNGIFGHMLDESRKMFGRPESAPKPEPPKPTPTRGTKIEAWLSDTPDPFMDNEMEPGVEIPAPLNTRTRPKQPHKQEEDRDRVSDRSPQAHHRRRSTRKRRVRSRGESSLDEPAKSTEDTASAASGKRSGDYRHSRASSIVEELTRVDDTKEELSEIGTLSEGSEVSGNNAPVPVSRKKPFPATGPHRLSTIVSVESMSTGTNGQSRAPVSGVVSNRRTSSSTQKEDDEERDRFDPDSLPSIISQLQRRLTTHDDLISVLSAPTGRSGSIRSARSIRTNKSRIANATVPDILKELVADETKYMRELKTLVGGVIPVLLTSVLSKSDSAIAAGLFRPSIDPQDEANFSQPIVDMGVAIERLKSLHKRVPREDAEALLNWATGAQRVYKVYLKAWRLGFKDVIVNLAPLEEGEASNDAETKSLDEGMERDENGDVVDSNGEKVDVAYLLKRPLVRLKYLAKTFKGINILQPSAKAEETAMIFQELVTEARRRAREERARLEDESAAHVDPTRARDPATLGPLAGVNVRKDRRVRARDFFSLSVYHSSGQVIDCRAELLLRDNGAGNALGGDLLVCEIDHADRWLLFPPIELAYVSARNGDVKGEIVVMLRSDPGQQTPWQELLLLRIEEDEVGFEWVQMLGMEPKPPTVSRSQSFIERAKHRQRVQAPTNTDSVPVPKMPPSPTNADVPIGERATSRTLRRSSPREQLSDPSTIESSLATESRLSLNTAITRDSDMTSPTKESPAKSSPQSSILHARDPRKVGNNDDKGSTGLKRSKAKRISRYGENSPASPSTPKEPRVGQDDPPSTPTREHGDLKRTEKALETPREKVPKEHVPPVNPTNEPFDQDSPRVSSVPLMNLPLIPKLRQNSSHTYLPQPLSSESDEEEDYPPVDTSALSTPSRAKTHSRSNSNSDSDQCNEDEPPPPPSHSRSPSSIGSSLPNTPVLSPSTIHGRRRGSSPLKHEYEPSTASDSYSDSDTSTVRRYDMYSDSDYSGSDTSDDSEDDMPSSPTRTIEDPKSTVQGSVVTSASSSISPSNPISQGGYRSVPPQPSKSSSTLASVYAWSDKGSWESLLSDDCKILVSPGLIEAYELSAAPPEDYDGTPSKQWRPIIALELTPLVPIRRGTAIDISIRSPPTPRSKINWSNNIMFRSRNADECEVLYGLINHARINNPTYIALQNARGPFADQPIPMERPSKSGGLFGWPRRRRSYRASTSPRSLADNSDSSVGTMSSAFSALKRFGAGSKMFSIARSSITSRSGQREDSLYSSSAGSGSDPHSGIGRIAAAIKGVDGIGLSNAKIRLYMRESQSKWRDMGAARLTIMPATPAPPRRPDTAASRHSDGATTTATGPDENFANGDSPPASGAMSPQRGIELEKRILIRGKTRNEVLLDACLGESSFERVARTGIAVSMRAENENGAMPKKGGVTSGVTKIYMIQMKSEAEAAYTFGLVGKLRY